jgi:hypothetical protein
MAEIAWQDKQRRTHRYLPRGEAVLGASDTVSVAAGEALGVIAADGTLAGVLVGPVRSEVSALPFVGALGATATFGRYSVSLLWAAAAPVELKAEIPLPPIDDPRTGARCSGASARATFGLAVTDVAKLVSTQHTEAKPLAGDVVERLAKQALGTACGTFWTQSREAVAARQAPMEEMAPKLAATVLEPVGLAVSGLKIELRLPVGFTPAPGSPLR